MPAHRVLLLIAGAILAVGLIAGFIPVSASGANCGSAFIASDDAFISDLRDAMTADATGGSYNAGTAQAACASLRSVVRIPAIALLAIGAVLGFTALYLRSQASTASS